jgi:hypothetical protein
LERVITLFRIVAVNLGYVVIENVDIAREVNSIWFLTHQVSFFAGDKISCRTMEKWEFFFICERTERQVK